MKHTIEKTNAASISITVNKLLRQTLKVLLVYLPWFIIGVAIVYFTLLLDYKLVRLMLHSSVGEIIVLFLGLVLVTVIGYYLCSYSLGPVIQLLRPAKKKQRNLLEIQPQDAPELFNVIGEIAAATGNKMPKHVYLTDDVNASVCYDHRLLSLFFPARKNLIVGAALLSCVSRGELYACLGHEFGHFAQGSMRIGSLLSLLNPVVEKLINSNRDWNTTLNKLMYFPWVLNPCMIVISLLARGLGWTLYGFTHWTQNLLENIYGKMQVDFSKLSREMEFEADAISAQIVDRDYSLSLLMKLDTVSERYGLFKQEILRLLEKGMSVQNYWDDFLSFNAYLTTFYGPPEENKTANQPHLEVEETYASHPATYQRIRALRNAKPINKRIAGDKAFDLIDETQKNRAASSVLESLCQLYGLKCHTEIDDEAFNHYLETYCAWYRVRPLLTHSLVEFDTAEAASFPDSDAIPEFKQAVAVFQAYNQAKQEVDVAHKAKNHEIEVDCVIYDGIKYAAHQVPIDLVEQRFEDCKKQAGLLDRAYFAHVWNRSSNREMVERTYNLVFYAQQCGSDFIEAFSPIYYKTVNMLNKNAGQMAEFEKLRAQLYDFHAGMTDLLGQIDWNFLGKPLTKEEAQILNYFSQLTGLLYANSISGPAIQCILDTYHVIINVFSRVSNENKSVIAQMFIDTGI